jgi:hypothetical protein
VGEVGGALKSFDILLYDQVSDTDTSDEQANEDADGDEDNGHCGQASE